MTANKQTPNNTTKFIFCLLGICCCLPWNFFMSSYDYYLIRLYIPEEINQDKGAEIEEIKPAEEIQKLTQCEQYMKIVEFTQDNDETDSLDNQTDTNDIASSNLLTTDDNETAVEPVLINDVTDNIDSSTTVNWLSKTCRCETEPESNIKPIAYWGTSVEESIILDDLNFGAYAMENQIDNLYKEYKTYSIDVKPKNTESEKPKIHQTYIQFWNSALSFVTMGTMLFSSIISNQDWLLKKFTQYQRAIYANYITIACLITTILMIYSSFAVGSFFIITLLVIVVMNLSTGVFQTTCFQMGPQQAPILFQSFIAGQAASGIIANVLAMLASFIVENIYQAPRTDQDKFDMNNLLSLMFFSVGVVTVFCALFSWKKLISMGLLKKGRENQDDDQSKEPLKENSKEIEAEEIPQIKSKMDIIIEGKAYYFSIWLCYSVTLALFPTLVIEAKSANIIPSQDGCGIYQFNPIFFKGAVLLMFNVGDFIGRIYTDQMFFFGITERNAGPKAKNQCLRLVFLRLLVFLPIFYLSNVTGFRRIPWIANDYVLIIAMLFFGASNGYLSTKAFMYAPQVFKKSEEIGIAGGLNVTFLTAGLLSGATLSFLSKAVLTYFQNNTFDGHVKGMIFDAAYNCLDQCKRM